MVNTTQIQQELCADAVGTFITMRVSPIEVQPDYVGRSLLSLGADGQVFTSDTAQRGVLGYDPFSNGQGSWLCLSNKGDTFQLSIRVLQFTQPLSSGDDSEIARLDIRADYDPITGSLNGSARIDFMPVDADPTMTGSAEPRIAYTFSAVRVEADHQQME